MNKNEKWPSVVERKDVTFPRFFKAAPPPPQLLLFTEKDRKKAEIRARNPKFRQKYVGWRRIGFLPTRREETNKKKIKPLHHSSVKQQFTWTTTTTTTKRNRTTSTTTIIIITSSRMNQSIHPSCSSDTSSKYMLLKLVQSIPVEYPPKSSNPN